MTRQLRNPLDVQVVDLPRKLADHGRAYLIHRVTQSLAEWHALLMDRGQESCHIRLVWNGPKDWHLRVWEGKGEPSTVVEGRVCRWFYMEANKPGDLPGLAYRMLVSAGVDMERPEDIEHTTVKQFTRVMRQKLEENRVKGGWQNSDCGYLLCRLDEEVEELKVAIRQRCRHGVTREAADVANFAMFIADNYGKLE